MDRFQRAGRKTLVIIIITILLLSLGSILLRLGMDANIWGGITRLAIMALLCLFMYRGRHWARISSAILLAIPALLFTLSAFPMLLLVLSRQVAIVDSSIFVAVALLHIIVVITLFTSEDVKIFMDYQQSR